MHWFGGFRRRWIWELGGKASLKTPTKVCNPPSPDGPSQFPLLPSGHLHKYAFHRPSIMSGQLILSLIIPWETTVWKLSVQFFANEIGLHLCVCILNLSSLFQSVIVTLWQGYLCCICICVCVCFTWVHCFSVWQGYLLSRPVPASFLRRLPLTSASPRHHHHQQHHHSYSCSRRIHGSSGWYFSNFSGQRENLPAFQPSNLPTF